jgi:hypothetical protein
MQLGSFEKRAPYSLGPYLRRRNERDGPRRLRLESLEEQELVVLGLLEQRAVPLREQEEEIAERRGEGLGD